MKLPTNKYIVEDTDGNILLEAPLMDLYYLIAFNSESDAPTQLAKMKFAAEAVNAEYGSSLSWGQVMEILTDLQDKVEEAKKKVTSSQE